MQQAIALLCGKDLQTAKPPQLDPLFLPAMWRHAALMGAAAAFLAPIPRHKHILRAEPRWVDGPTDIGEAGAMSRHIGGAVCVLYFNPMGEGGAAALSTVEFAGQALPQCEFLLASQDRDKECWGAFDALPADQALPCVEVFDGGVSQGIVAAGDLIATLASLGYKPGGGAAPSQGSVDSDQFFNLADDLWWRSAESRNEPRPKTPPPTNRRQEQRQQAGLKPPRTTARSQKASRRRAPHVDLVEAQNTNPLTPPALVRDRNARERSGSAGAEMQERPDLL